MDEKENGASLEYREDQADRAGLVQRACLTQIWQRKGSQGRLDHKEKTVSLSFVRIRMPYKDLFNHQLLWFNG